MITIDKAIELNKESVQSLKKHKFFDHADAIQLGIEALKRERVHREGLRLTKPELLPGEDPPDPKTIPIETLVKIRESPLGRKPKAKLLNTKPPKPLFNLADLRLSALLLYKQLSSHKDRQPRYTLLRFAGATPKQAQYWRDWSVTHFQLLFDYLFNPEPLADDLVNNRLGLSEEGLKSLAVA